MSFLDLSRFFEGHPVSFLTLINIPLLCSDLLVHSRSSGAAFHITVSPQNKSPISKNFNVARLRFAGVQSCYAWEILWKLLLLFFGLHFFFLLSIIAIFQVLPNSGGNGNAATDKWPSSGSTGTNHLLSFAFLGVAISAPKDDKLFNIQYNRSISVGAYKCIQVRCPASHSGLLESEEQEVIAESCLDICIKMLMNLWLKGRSDQGRFFSSWQ